MMRNSQSMVASLTNSAHLLRDRKSRTLWSGSLALFAALLMLLFLPITASAHAEYVSSDPGANAMLQKAPSTITIHFSENVDPAGSDIQIFDVDGKMSSNGPAQVDHANLTTMTVGLKADNSEVYVVNWHTVSAVEGHHDSGSFRFFVNISPMLQGMLNGKMSGMPANGSQGSMASTSANAAGFPLWSILVAALLGLLVGGGATFLFARPALQRPNSRTALPDKKTQTRV